MVMRLKYKLGTKRDLSSAVDFLCYYYLRFSRIGMSPSVSVSSPVKSEYFALCQLLFMYKVLYMKANISIFTVQMGQLRQRPAN